MKLSPVLFYCLLLLPGCKVYTFTIVDKKTPTRPYSKIMAIYLDEACDFTLFDSTTYNICLKSCFQRADNLELRGTVEQLLAAKIGTRGTVVVSSADMLDSVTNSYTDFTKAITEGSYDALLLVSFRKINHKIYFNGDASHRGSGEVYQKLVPGFQCFLFNAKNSNFPVWTAQLEIGNKTYSAHKGLTGGMANEIAKSLKTIGYIAH
ncbi:MAG TPA: hypothetical protein VK563_05440 [Puia sp.]|nr:hypothetical protein [Puia sp.]